MIPVEELVAILGFDMQGEGDLRRWKQGLENAQHGLNEFARTAGVMAVAVAGAMKAASIAIGKSVIETNAQFEQFEATLTTIEGSAEKARASMDWITDFAVTTPYELAEITDGFVRLKAYGIDPVDGTLKTLGDTAAAMGKPLMDSVEMFADAATFQFERLRSFGITASQAGDQVTFSWNENGETLKKTIKKNSDEVRTFLEENLGRRFAGAMEMQSKTWNGIVGNISDTWTKFQKTIGDAGFFEAVKQRLSDFLDTLDLLQEDGTLDRWAKAISDNLTSQLESAERVFLTLAADAKFLWEAFQEMDPAWLKAIGAAFGYMLARAFPLMFVLGGLALAIEDVIAYARGADETVFGSIVQWMQDMTGASEGLAEVLAGIAGSLGLIAGLSLILRPGGAVRGVVGALTGLVGLAAGTGGAVAAGGAAAGSVAGAVAGAGGGLGSVMGISRLALTSATIGSMVVSEMLANLTVEERVDRTRRTNESWNRWADNSIFGDVSSALNRIGDSIRGWFDSGSKGSVSPDDIQAAYQRYQGNMAKMDGAGAAVVNDNSDRSNHTTITVGGTTVHVQSATSAPAAAGRAIGEAIGRSARQATTPSRVQTNPHF